jgi:hypothetical protein
LRSVLNSYFLQEKVDDAKSFFAHKPQPAPNSPDAIARDAMKLLSTIPEGRELVNSLHWGQHVQVELNRQPQNLSQVNFDGGNFNIKSDGIALDYVHLPLMTVMMAHELEHMRQMNAHLLYPFHEKMPPPADRIFYNRAIEADASATATEVAWKLGQAGHPEVWEAQSKYQPGISKAYQDAVAANPAAATDGRAKRAAYDAWYQEKDWQGIPYTQSYVMEEANALITPDIVKSMAKAGHPLAPVEKNDIAKLGTLSDANYLTLPGQRPLDDPYYRARDWSAAQGARIDGWTREYETVKTGAPPPLPKPSIPEAIPTIWPSR